jgi:hypothetical protein
MKLYCPYCTKEVAPQTPQCPFCGTPYSMETLLLLKNLVREALPVDPDDQGAGDHVCFHEGAGVGH